MTGSARAVLSCERVDEVGGERPSKEKGVVGRREGNWEIGGGERREG